MQVLAPMMALAATDTTPNIDVVTYDSSKNIDRQDFGNGHYIQNDVNSGYWLVFTHHFYSNAEEAQQHLPVMPARCHHVTARCISAVLLGDSRDGATYAPGWTDVSFTICAVLTPTDYRVKCTDRDAIRVIIPSPKVTCDPTGKCVPPPYPTFFPQWRPGEAPNF